jgi:hypothetical protein
LTSIPPDPQPSLAAPRTEENKENMADAWLALANDPILWLDRLSAVWRILKPWQQQLDFKQVWILLDEENYKNNMKIF